MTNIEDKIRGEELALLTDRNLPTDAGNMEGIYIGYIRQILHKHGDEGFTLFTDTYRKAGGTHKDFDFNHQNYSAFKAALVAVIQKYGRL